MKDQETTIQELKDVVGQFCKERDWDQFNSAKDIAIGISSEANELLSLFRFKSEEDVLDMFTKTKKKEHIEEELCDVLYFVLSFARLNNIDISKAFMKKMQKNAEHYPVELAKGNNKKYNEM